MIMMSPEFSAITPIDCAHKHAEVVRAKKAVCSADQIYLSF